MICHTISLFSRTGLADELTSSVSRAGSRAEADYSGDCKTHASEDVAVGPSSVGTRCDEDAGHRS